MIRYFITSHEHLPGVRLSRVGSWGNIQHPDEESAKLAAAINAGGHPFKVARERFGVLPQFPQGERGRP